MSENKIIVRRVCEFYEGKCIFMTGVAGYVGSVMLELLLRCAPGIKSIYILLRPKNDLDPEARKRIIFEKPIFNTVLEENPKVADKVHVIAGDVSQPHLGMTDEQLAELTQSVTIVFHAAANISFSRSMKFMAIQNCLGTKHVIDFCRKLQNLEAFIYTSTAYSNCNRLEVDEIIYRLPHKATDYLDALEKDEKEFERLVSLCKPDWPNEYTFSKCLAENVVNDLASDLPVAVLRPSIIGSIWKGKYEGYIEEGFGVVELSMAVGRGFARVLLADPNARFDLTAVDVVANAHIVAGFCIGTKRFPTPFIVNCTGHNFKVSFGDYTSIMLKLSQKYMCPNTFQEPDVYIVKNKYLYYLCVFYEHFLPAFFIDKYLAMKGKKLRLLPLYNFFEKVMAKLSYFISRTITFEGKNYFALETQLEPRDKEIFYMDMKDLDFKEVVDHVPFMGDFYAWKHDKKSPPRRKEIVMVRTMFIRFIKRFFLLLVFILIFLIIKQIFF